MRGCPRHPTPDGRARAPQGIFASRAAWKQEQTAAYIPTARRRGARVWERISSHPVPQFVLSATPCSYLAHLVKTCQGVISEWSGGPEWYVLPSHVFVLPAVPQRPT